MWLFCDSDGYFCAFWTDNEVKKNSEDPVLTGQKKEETEMARRRFLVIALVLAMAVICSGCMMDIGKLASSQINAQVMVQHAIITTITRKVPKMKDGTISFASLGGAEVKERNLIIYNPIAVTGTFGGQSAGIMIWTVPMKVKEGNIIIEIPTDTDYRVCISDQCRTFLGEGNYPSY